jgi:thymidylate kinase
MARERGVGCLMHQPDRRSGLSRDTPPLTVWPRAGSAPKSLTADPTIARLAWLLVGGKGGPSGRIIGISGPDGSGKSTLCHELAARSLASRRVLHLHHRPHVLPSRVRAPVARPHGLPPYPKLLSGAKALYLFLDFAFGWMVRVRPLVRRGAWVLLERGWWDIVVDPARYRLSGIGRLARFLGTCLPKPDVTVVLEAPAEQLRERKAELSLEELSRQMTAWRELGTVCGRVYFLDASLPQESVVHAAEVAISRGEAR